MNSKQRADEPRPAAPPQATLTNLTERLAYLELTPEDQERLRAMAPRLKSSAVEFVEVFYRHLFSFEQTARFLQDPALVARLKEAQQRHLESMLEAQWDEAYVAQRYRVGEVHALVGINPQIFLGAYNQYLQYCVRELSTGCDQATSQFAEQIQSLQRAMFLDVGLTLEAYFTHAMQNLRQALDLVYRANTELRQFAQLTSHDLKTPLATMANLCDEALDEFREQIPPEAAKLIETAQNQAYRMSRTIDELLNSAMSLHTDSGLGTVASEDAINEAVELVRPQLKQKNIRLQVTPNLPVVLGDRARLREVFYNLLTNAIKFSDKPNAEIRIGCQLQDGECVFSVADTGSGIPADELSRVFVPFRRLPSHRSVPGSGLGLYFAKTIVEQQQGRIWAESTLGEGSTFYVLLRTPRQKA